VPTSHIHGQEARKQRKRGTAMTRRTAQMEPVNEDDTPAKVNAGVGCVGWGAVG
jgi:hypothetical protein